MISLVILAVSLDDRTAEIAHRALSEVSGAFGLAPRDPSQAFRAVLALWRLIVGILGFAAIAALASNHRRAAVISSVGAVASSGLAAVLYAGPWPLANAITCVVAIGAAGMVAWWPGRRELWKRVVLACVIGAGTLAITSFMNFHDWRAVVPEADRWKRWGAIHYHDDFHYYLGAKYFHELSYDGIYSCAALVALERGEPIADWGARDLTTNRSSTIGQIATKSGACRARFTPERWRGFSDDVTFFRVAVDERARARYTTDHGYNATPFLTALHRPLVVFTRASDTVLGSLALIDVLLFVACVALIAWAFGPAASALATLAWGTGVLWVYAHVGLPGSIGRLWWITSIVAAVCCAQRHRYVAAGVCLAVAVVLRAFPAVFLVVPVIVIAVDIFAARRLHRPLIRIVLGCGLGTVALVAVSVVALGGVAPYAAFAANSSKHAASGLSNFVGLSTILPAIAYLLGVSASARPRPWHPLMLAPAVLVLAYTVLACRRLESAVVLGLGGLTVLLSFMAVTNYDYALFLLLGPLLLALDRAPRRMDWIVLAGGVLLHNVIFIIAPGHDVVVYRAGTVVALATVVYFLTRWALARPSAASSSGS